VAGVMEFNASFKNISVKSWWTFTRKIDLLIVLLEDLFSNTVSHIVLPDLFLSMKTIFMEENICFMVNSEISFICLPNPSGKIRTF
jgi:hypothetical protein